MVDEIKKDEVINVPEEVVLTIALNLKTNAININGPINDRVLAYGMLEYARDAIFEHNKKQEQSSIVKANGHNIMNFIRRK